MLDGVGASAAASIVESFVPIGRVPSRPLLGPPKATAPSLESLVEELERDFGQPLLHARDEADVSELVERTLTDARWVQRSSVLSEMLIKAIVELEGMVRTVARGTKELFGIRTAIAIGKAQNLGEVTAIPFLKLVAKNVKLAGIVPPRGPTDSDMRPLTEEHIPLAIQEQLLDIAYGGPAVFALSFGMRHRQRATDSVVAEVLALYWLRGARATYRLLRATPGIRLPSRTKPRDVVPLDMKAINREHAEYMRRLDRSLEEARARNFAVSWD